MPRRARKDNVCDLFHVIVQGINKEYIFEKEEEIKTYLTYLKDRIYDKNLHIIAYCIMNNHAHFLVYTPNTKEISKLMSQVNTKYAKFYNKKYNRCGFVFRGRYKAEEIMTFSHLISCINYIHNNPVKAKMCVKKSDYKYSSYYAYIKEKDILVDIEAVKKILENYGIIIEDILKAKYECYRFLEDTAMENKEEVKEKIINNFLEENMLEDIEEIVSKKQYLQKFSSLLYMDYGFTQKEIAEMLRIDRLKIHRIIHEL